MDFAGFVVRACPCGVVGPLSDGVCGGEGFGGWGGGICGASGFGFVTGGTVGFSGAIVATVFVSGSSGTGGASMIAGRGVTGFVGVVFTAFFVMVLSLGAIVGFLSRPAGFGGIRGGTIIIPHKS